MRWMLALALAGTWVGCVDPADLNCPDALRPSFVIITTDSLTGEAVEGAVVWVQDGEFVDTLDTYGAQSDSPWGRPGTYAVRAEHPSYELWERDGVKIVQENRCSTSQVHLTARMQPVQ